MMDKAVLLMSQYCDNDLSHDEQAELVAWLKSDPSHVDRFVRATHLHSLLYDLTQEQQLQSSAWSHTLKEDAPYVPAATTKPQPLSNLINKSGRMFAIAAVLAGILATVALWSAMNRTLVAQITSLNGTVKTASGETVLVGTILPAGETLSVEDGSLLVTFQCGAKVLVEKNSVFVVEGKAIGALLQGIASARVPTQAIGFTINTPLVDVVDLGTEFQLNILNKRQVDLHVFDGSVEARMTKQFHNANNVPLTISEGRSTRFDLDADEVVNLEYDESLKREF